MAQASLAPAAVHDPGEPATTAAAQDGFLTVNYVAAQDPKDPGVLILSRFAGAALQLKDAILVNPYSKDEISDALLQALNMPKSERIRRWKALNAVVKRDDVLAWRKAFIAALENVRPPG